METKTTTEAYGSREGRHSDTILTANFRLENALKLEVQVSSSKAAVLNHLPNAGILNSSSCCSHSPSSTVILFTAVYNFMTIILLLL